MPSESDHTILNAMMDSCQCIVEAAKGQQQGKPLIDLPTLLATLDIMSNHLWDLESRLIDPNNQNLWAVGALVQMRETLEFYHSELLQNQSPPEPDHYSDDGNDDGLFQYEGSAKDLSDAIIAFAKNKLQCHTDKPLECEGWDVDKEAGTFKILFMEVE